MFKIIIAGFGGQGILFLGKTIIKCAVLNGFEGTWLPSYGPEMRGGAANCHVILSKKTIFSPIISKPDILVCMNEESFNKFKTRIKPNGVILTSDAIFKKKFYDSEYNANIYSINTAKIAEKKGCMGKENMVMLGAIIRLSKIFTKEAVVDYIKSTVSCAKKELIEENISAINGGFDYSERFIET